MGNENEAVGSLGVGFGALCRSVGDRQVMVMCKKAQAGRQLGVRACGDGGREDRTSSCCASWVRMVGADGRDVQAGNAEGVSASMHSSCLGTLKVTGLELGE